MNNQTMKYFLLLITFVVAKDLFSQELESGQFEKPAVSAEYPGGIQEFYNYISDSLKYPPKAIEQNIEGIVSVYFVLNSSGEIVGRLTEVKMSTNDIFNQEAIRLINSSPNWIPAKRTKDGPNIKEQRIMPIRFVLPKESRRRKK
jgi:protein TonB